MAAAGVDDHLIAAAEGCTVARVRAVLATPPAPPRPRPATVRRDRAATSSIATVLDLLEAVDDPRAQRFVAHIRHDIDLARQLLRQADDRAHHAGALVAADVRQAATWADHDTHHRRTADQQETTS
jgi:hypothetical protein